MATATMARSDIKDKQGNVTNHAYGLMQLTPETAAKYGLSEKDGSIYDVNKNVAAGSAELARLRKKYNGDMTKVLAEYNTGIDASNGIGGFHQDVKDYATKVINGYYTRVGKQPPGVPIPLAKPSPAIPKIAPGGAPAAAQAKPTPETVAGPPPRGLLVPGNIDLNARIPVKNDDGSISTEFSMSFRTRGGREVLVPSIYDGKFLTPDGKKPQEGTRDKDGRYHFTTIRPGAVPARGNAMQAPHINLRLFARGLLKHVSTRIYFAEEPLNRNDPVLASIEEPARQQTLIASARREGARMVYRFDIRLQGKDETVFFDV